jgi:hypothetical protein
MRSNWVRMAEEVDWEGMRLSKMPGISPVRTAYPHPPYPVEADLRLPHCL